MFIFLGGPPGPSNTTDDKERVVFPAESWLLVKRTAGPSASLPMYKMLNQIESTADLGRVLSLIS